MSKTVEIRSGDKSELLKYFKKIPVFSESQSTSLIVDVAFLGGLLIVNTTNSKKTQLKKNTVEKKKYLKAHCAEAIDLVFETYKSVKLKKFGRCNRGKRVRRKVESISLAPTIGNRFCKLGTVD